MSSGDRFYQLDFRHRSVLKGDIGSLLKIEGLVVGGCGANAILLLPGADEPKTDMVYRLSQEEWSEYLQQSDVPEVMVGPSKAFHRKVRYEISGAVQQKVWVADNLQCMYCGKKMGDVQLTIDHFIPLELSGVNNVSNYLSACRRCNKDKGSEDPKDFLARRKNGLPLAGYAEYVSYLLKRQVK